MEPVIRVAFANLNHEAFSYILNNKANSNTLLTQSLKKLNAHYAYFERFVEIGDITKFKNSDYTNSVTPQPNGGTTKAVGGFFSGLTEYFSTLDVPLLEEKLKNLFSDTNADGTLDSGEINVNWIQDSITEVDVNLNEVKNNILKLKNEPGVSQNATSDIIDNIYKENFDQNKMDLFKNQMANFISSTGGELIGINNLFYLILYQVTQDPINNPPSRLFTHAIWKYFEDPCVGMGSVKANCGLAGLEEGNFTSGRPGAPSGPPPDVLPPPGGNPPPPPPPSGEGGAL
jgi:hypothetical protein